MKKTLLIIITLLITTSCTTVRVSDDGNQATLTGFGPAKAEVDLKNQKYKISREPWIDFPDIEIEDFKSN